MSTQPLSEGTVATAPGAEQPDEHRTRKAPRTRPIGAAAGGPSDSDAPAWEPVLIAYRVGAGSLQLVPAPRDRAWMDATRNRFAQRCLPMLLANQAGWWILNSHALTVVWEGGDDQAALHLDFHDGAPPYPAVSHFGHGILTWHVPYLFRTPPGWNLLARGPANRPKDGIFALEGLVETDWAVATFTMNWQLTRPGVPIEFAVGEPICQVVPQRRGALEAFWPEVREVASDPRTAAGFQAWTASRSAFNADLYEEGSDAAKRGWQRDYFHGAAPDGTAAPEHQTKLRLREFGDPNGVCLPAPHRARER